MATKPTSVPIWNTGTANRTEPSAGKKVLGWIIGEEPPSSYFNWLQGLTGDWLQYLSDGNIQTLLIETVQLVASGYLSTAEADVRHAAATIQISSFDMVGIGASPTYSSAKISSAAALTVYVPLRAKQGDKITGCRLRADDLGAGAFVVKLRKVQISTRTATDVATLSPVGGGTDHWYEVALLVSPELVAADYKYEIYAVSAAGGGEVYGAEVSYKRD